MYTQSKNNSKWIKAQYYPIDLEFIDEPYVSPERSAVLASKHNKTYTDAATYIKNLQRHQLETNPVLDELARVVERSQNAARVCSSITTVNFRHLMAEGFTPHDIADALGLNVLDLMAYLSSHPEADVFVKQDMTACADARMRKLLIEMDDSAMESKYEADRQKNKLYATELLLKRLSPEWVAQSRATAETLAESTAGMTVNMQIGQINTGGAQVTNNTQNNYSPAQLEAAAQLAEYQKNMQIEQDQLTSLSQAELELSHGEMLTAEPVAEEDPFTSPAALAESLKEETQDRQNDRLRNQSRQARRESSSEFKPVVTQPGYDKHTGE